MGKNIKEELNFLKEELKKINDKIKELKYGSSVIEEQEKLWGLKENIEEKINDCEYLISSREE